MRFRFIEDRRAYPVRISRVRTTDSRHDLPIAPNLLELVDRNTSETLKYGITSQQNPQDRYVSDYYKANNADMVVLGSYSTRWMARAEELRLNENYVINNGSFPPLTFRW